ncbi:MFS transporter [Natronorubrum sp. FCH18a]|uniref:MFS transporter n=1 Tax=Natronorubrum sp. FCH18a TaxID=3447018 RepID=UPI003F51A4A8
MFVVQWIGSLTFLMLTVLTPFLKDDFGVTTTEIGLLMTMLYAGYFSSLTLGGVLTDHAGERFALVLGMGLIGFMALVVSALPTFWSLVVGVYFLGLGYGSVPSGTNKGIFDWFPSDQRTVGISIKQTGVMFGGATGAALLPVAATWIGWRPATASVGLVALCTIGLLYAYSPKDVPTGTRVPPISQIVEKHRRLLRLAKRRDVFPFLLSGVLFGATQFTLMAYIVLYLTEELLLAPAIAGLLYTAMQLTGMGSRIGFGVLTDSYFLGAKRLVLAGIGIAGFVVYVPFLFLTADTSPWIAFGVLLLVGAISLGYNGVYLTMATEMTTPDEAGVTTAMAVTAVMAGAVIFPPVIGLVIDVTGSYTVPFVFLGVATLAAGITAAFGTKNGTTEPT